MTDTSDIRFFLAQHDCGPDQDVLYVAFSHSGVMWDFYMDFNEAHTLLKPRMLPYTEDAFALTAKLITMILAATRDDDDLPYVDAAIRILQTHQDQRMTLKLGAAK